MSSLLVLSSILYTRNTTLPDVLCLGLYVASDCTTEVRFPAGAVILSPDRLWCQPSLMCNFPVIRRLEREADHSTSSTAGVKNAWSYTSTPDVFTTWHLLKQQNFRFYILWGTKSACIFLHLWTILLRSHQSQYWNCIMSRTIQAA
jgi:hypothetical protein